MSNGSNVTAQDALRLLKEGNERFVNGVRSVESMMITPEKIRTLAEKGQKPFSIILGCADSRCPAEILFDQGMGDLFVLRVAGNVSTQYLAASIEYAALNLGTPLCVVLGHTSCGAVAAATDWHLNKSPLPSKNLEELLQKIEPAVESVVKKKPDAPKSEMVYQITLENIRKTMGDLQTESPVLAKLVKEGKFTIAGAIIDLPTGKVNFL